MSTATWTTWLGDIMADLNKGEQVQVPIPPLSHPRNGGFVETTTAEPKAGKLRDWVKPLPGGGRLHIHEFEGPRFVVHLDKADPERGPSSGLTHFFTESGTGRVVLILGVLAVVGVLVWKYAK